MADLPSDPTAAPLIVASWEWDSVLDFSIGSPDHMFPWHSEELPSGFNDTLFPSQDVGIQPPSSEPAENFSVGTQDIPLGNGSAAESEETKRIRKRDPRLSCSNFLAGRVPCSCPEMEGNEEEEWSRKRVKVAVTRCQVPSCEADISHLKGYHRRHRVCLRCANAATVVLDEVPQRYCQQCGKFHLLPDFDEGKRSCRRKLERHNNRRRRKPADVVKASMQGQTSRTATPLQNADEETTNDGKSGQESKSFSSLGTAEKQTSSGSEEVRISEVEQPYKDRSSFGCAEPRSANVDKVYSKSRTTKTSTEIEDAGKLHPDRDLGDGENFNDRNLRGVENSQASPSKILAGPQDDDNDSTYAEFNEQSFTGLLMEENSHKDRFLHDSNGGNLRRDEGAGPLKSSLSSTGHDKQFSYTSVCPTGRISFKLYDWNPAEFPRRLRQQILQWLANMPVELEGYIRPGCTILTAFIALPQFMWEKLYADSTGYVRNLVNGYGSVLLGKGNMLVYLNNMVMQVEKGEPSLLNMKLDQRVPELYSVHPIFIEAGQPIEIVACGKNLFQPKFRFLISFGGKYLHYDSCEVIPLGKTDSTLRSKENVFQASEHELCKIFIPFTDSKLFGPAFIEVENESGLSNFIPILIGNKEVCSEFQRLEQELVKSILCCRSKSEHVEGGKSDFDICRLNLLKWQSVLDLFLDIGWVLKEPHPDENEIPVNYVHIQRLNCLFRFLINGRSLSLTEKVLHSPKVLKILEKVYEKSKEFNDVDAKLLQKYVEHARLSLSKKSEYQGNANFWQFVGNVLSQELSPPLKNTSTLVDLQPCEESTETQEIEPLLEIQTEIKSSTQLESEDSRILSVEENNILIPLLEKESSSNIAIDMKHDTKWGVPKMINVVGCAQKMKIDFNGGLGVNRRVFILAITVLFICAGICVVLQHPHQVMEISMSLRRCLFGLHNDEVASVP